MTSSLSEAPGKLERYGKQVHAGFLDKRSKGTSWTQRYVVLWEDMSLRFYETEQCGGFFGKIKMKHVTNVTKVASEQSRELDATKPFFFSIVSTSLDKKWQFGCDTQQDLNEWIHTLQSAMPSMHHAAEAQLAHSEAKTDGADETLAASNEISVASMEASQVLPLEVLMF